MKVRAEERWDRMRPPTTAKERISYLQACYSHFTAALASRPDPLPAIATRAGGGTLDPPRLHGTSELVALPASGTFACVACGAASEMSARSATLANPYSKWVVLRCERCASGASDCTPA